MFRGVAGGIAVLAGDIVALLEIWLWFGSPQITPLGALILLVLWLPAITTVLILGLVGLEAVVKRAPPSGRSGVFMGGGAIAIPLAAALMSLLTNIPTSVLDATGAPAGPAALMVAAGFVVPSLVMCALYVLITAFEPDKSRPDVTPAPAPAPQAPPPRAPVLNLNLSLPSSTASEPFDSGRIMDVLTSPHHRIGQQHFLAVMGVLAIASQVWFPLPFILGGILRFEQDVRIALALFGWLVLFWGAFCAIANRLHDLGLSAVWATTPMLAALAWLLIEGEPRLGWTPQTALFHWVIATAICFAIAAAILLLRKGEPWSNQYGSEQV